MVQVTPSSIHRVAISKTRRKKEIASALKNSISNVKTFFQHPDDELFGHYKRQVTNAVLQILLKEFPEKMKFWRSCHQAVIAVNKKKDIFVLLGNKDTCNFPIQVQVDVCGEDLECIFVNRNDYSPQDPDTRKITGNMKKRIEQEEERRKAQAYSSPSFIRKLTSCCSPPTPDYSRTNSCILYKFTKELSDFNQLMNQETLSSLNIAPESEKSPMVTIGVPVFLGTQA